MNESKLLMSKISKDDFVVAWDSMGEQNNSKKFSNFLKSFEKINQNICFVIGGSFGLSLDIKNNADKVFSASLLTFPHRLFRLILVEQIYRAHTIISNMPYHK
jgi:23S rRNA (pseudouridine1915-N3)-methyltransferase